MKIYILLILFIQILLCISCGSGRNEMIFSESESLLDIYPDSALSVLGSILYPEDLNLKEYNRYILLKIQAEYKSYQDITSDSTILSVKEYYLKKKDIHNIALSSYYCGCYYNECDNKEKALENYLLALDYAEKTADLKLKGLISSSIGNVLLTQFDIESAMSFFHRSTDFYKQADDLRNEAISYIQIGNCFQYWEEPDSALFYYTRCLNIVDKEKLCKEQANVRLNIGILYSEKGELSKAIQYLKEALVYEPNQMELVKIYNAMSELYIQNCQMDSAYVYINQSLRKKDHIKDSYIKANLYEILSNIEEKQGDYLTALKNHKLYLENVLSIFDTELDKNLLDLQRKYDYEKIRLQNVQLKLNRIYLLIYLVISLLIVFVVSYIYYRRYRLNKDKVSELEEKILQLRYMAENFDEKEKSFRSYLLRHFDILKKVARMEIHLKKNESKKNDFWLKKFNEIVYGRETLDWEILYEVMNELYDGFFSRLKNLYPQLDETEFRIVCLTYTKFSSVEISLILGLSVNTINTKRSAIRRSIGVESFGSLDDFLNQKLNE